MQKILFKFMTGIFQRKAANRAARRTRRSNKKKNPNLFRLGFNKERRRHTLPQIAVPSAQAGLTTLFGMGRGEPRRNNHLKIIV